MNIYIYSYVTECLFSMFPNYRQHIKSCHYYNYNKMWDKSFKEKKKRVTHTKYMHL